LTSLAALVLIGLIAIAVGAHLVGPSTRVLSWREFGLLALAFSVGGGFFSFVAGGWAAARVAGTWRPEDAMLHGAVAWLLTIPLLLGVAALGGNSVVGPWYGGLAGRPAWANAPVAKTTATDATEAEKKEADEALKAARNSDLGALTALLLGLAGSVLGGWLATERIPFPAFGHSGGPIERVPANRVTV